MLVILWRVSKYGEDQSMMAMKCCAHDHGVWPLEIVTSCFLSIHQSGSCEEHWSGQRHYKHCLETRAQCWKLAHLVTGPFAARRTQPLIHGTRQLQIRKCVLRPGDNQTVRCSVGEELLAKHLAPEANCYQQEVMLSKAAISNSAGYATFLFKRYLFSGT